MKRRNYCNIHKHVKIFKLRKSHVMVNEKVHIGWTYEQLLFLERAHTWERHVSVACKSANFPRMQKDFPCNTVHIAAIHNSWELKVNYSDILDVKISHMGISKGCSREGIFNLSFGGFRIYTCLSNHIFLQHTTKRTTSSYNKYYPLYDYWF